MITSAANQQIKNVIQLQQKAKERRIQDLYVAEGKKMFLEAPVEVIRQVYLSENLAEEIGYTEAMSKNTDRAATEKGKKTLAKKANADDKVSRELLDKLYRCGAVVVANDLFLKMSDTQTPQGVICVLQKQHYQLEQMIRGKSPLLLLLEGVQDPGNLGTMFRTAEGAGVCGIIMSKETVDLYNPKTVRSTMGSIYRMPFMYTDDIRQTIRTLKANDIQVFAAHLKGKKMYDAFDYTKGCGFLIGNEGNGLTKETADEADTYLLIPMEGQLESLNAAVSAAVLMYEANRQRRV